MVCCKHEQQPGNDGADIIPLILRPGLSASDLVDLMGTTCFEARVLARGARLFKRMIDDGMCNWLGIAGAAVAGGQGGLVSSLADCGFIDLICTTGAQAYHDLHFAYNLPVKAVSPSADDNQLRAQGDTRIYDIGIREKETLEAQDEIICRFIREQYLLLSRQKLSSPVFMKMLGDWVAEDAPYPERSFVVSAARAGVPVFWDSFTNHSIALNIAKMAVQGMPLHFGIEDDILLSAALAYGERNIGFLELGGGGPKNFIQQTGPILQQILGIDDYHGAECGIQISTANVREGGLSGCTFGEAVTWGKYESDDAVNLVQIWGEYSVVFPLLTAYVLDRCTPRSSKNLLQKMDVYLAQMMVKVSGSTPNLASEIEKR